jgi:hypothetical protein
MEQWEYPEEFLEVLPTFGLKPTAGTPPLVVRDALNDLYRYEIRRLRECRLAGTIAKVDYVPAVIALRKKYWPLSLQPSHWEQIIRSVPAPTGDRS